MKKARRIIGFVLIFCMLAGSFVFAASPRAGIVSPIENSILASDSLLVSVKVSDKNKICVTVYEEKISTLDQDGKAVRTAIDVKDFTEESFEEVKKNFEDKKYTDQAISEPAVYTAVGEAGYFTKTVAGLQPGLYRVQVEVLGKDDAAEETYNSFVALQGKPEEKTEDVQEIKPVAVEVQKANIVQSLVNLIKSIVK